MTAVYKEEEIYLLACHNIISSSASPWASVIVIVTKKDGTPSGFQEAQYSDKERCIPTSPQLSESQWISTLKYGTAKNSL